MSTLMRHSELARLPDVTGGRHIAEAIVWHDQGSNLHAAGIERLACVHRCEEPPTGEGDFVGEDSACVGALAANDLLLIRCRRLVLLEPHENSSSAMLSRAASFAATADVRGAALLQVRDQAGTLHGLVRAARGASERAGAGIFIPGNDARVIAACVALSDAGLRVGRDVQVVCGHSAPAQYVWPHWPAARVIDTGPEQIGEAAVEAIERRIANPNAGRRRLLVKPKFTRNGANPLSD